MSYKFFVLRYCHENDFFAWQLLECEVPGGGKPPALYWKRQKQTNNFTQAGYDERLVIAHAVLFKRQFRVG